jgi:hypothetical protein
MKVQQKKAKFIPAYLLKLAQIRLNFIVIDGAEGRVWSWSKR